MSKYFFLLLILISFILCADKNKDSKEPTCKEWSNFCLYCNETTSLCSECFGDAFIPDEEGGCVPVRKCTPNHSHCKECSEEEEDEEEPSLCATCDDGFYPDKNGGCAQTKHCDVSLQGTCRICEENYMLVIMDNSILGCKNKDSEDLKHCKEIDSFGKCKTCENGYYLRKDTKFCTKNFCEQFEKNDEDEEICKKCLYGYYLDKKDNYMCKKWEEDDKFLYCAESKDGKDCSKCLNDNYFLSPKDKKCSVTNHCDKRKEGSFQCEECSEGYYLTSRNKGDVCANSEGCVIGLKESGNCTKCQNFYYFNPVENSCGSANEDNEFKFCARGSEKCEQCMENYFLGKDSKCTYTNYCEKSKGGICNECSEGYFLSSFSHICTKFENCAIGINENSCYECIPGYVFDPVKKSCNKEDEYEKKDFTGCRVLDNKKGEECDECREDYYLNIEDNKCYNNTDEDSIELYKCALANKTENICLRCIPSYYQGLNDSRCTPVEDCAESEMGECVKCNEDYCLNHGTGKCEIARFPNEFQSTSCYHCIETSKSGRQCKKCEEGYELSDEGYCYDISHCEKFDKNSDGDEKICKQCQQVNYLKDQYENYCLSEKHGCVETAFDGCAKCNEMDLSKCGECLDGYYLDNLFGFCNPCKDGCKTCSTYKNCGECDVEEGWFTRIEASLPDSYDAECGRCIKGCKKCNNDKDCEECYPGYYPTNENTEEGRIVCAPCSEGCIECNDEAVCLECDANYELVPLADEILCVEVGSIERK